MLPDKLDLYFDGSCGPNNPGGTAGYAWRLVHPDTGVVLAQDCGEVCRGPAATNNVGEWGAVKAGLEYLVAQGWKGELNIRGDSQLVIYQLIGRYKCRKDTLIPFYEACMLILKDMEWDAHWIPREQNDECDRMSKQAYAIGRRVQKIFDEMWQDCREIREVWERLSNLAQFPEKKHQKWRSIDD